MHKREISFNQKRSRDFYEQYGRNMIHEEFPEYENRIAVGLVGKGSDCFGFDDEISADHDYMPGFCMWLTQEDYDKIGKQLQTAYDCLVESVYTYKNEDKFIRERRGVTTISEFYNRILRTSYDFQGSCRLDYLRIRDDQLATATNGAVFKDELGIFTGVRKKLLEHYPDAVMRKKLAQEVHEFSQYAQSNYPRMMARDDRVTANLCINKAVESAMNIVYLLNKQYAPYYKWKRKGLEMIASTQPILRILDEIATVPYQASAWQNVNYSSTGINMSDRIVVLFEQLAQTILDDLKKQGLVSGNELFLELHIEEILSEEKKLTDNRQEKIYEVIRLEWKQFDKVQNEGGRASCQNDYETFYIMRASQYLTWPESLLQSFIGDLESAASKGWNLITEKYARMMKNTNPVSYNQIESKLPPLSEERIKLQEVVVRIQVGWMEAFAQEFPKMAGGSRHIYSKDDNAYRTSYETYLRGEISTYSEKTFALYTEFILSVLKDGRNLTREIMTNTAKLYGYVSLEEAERKHQ